MQAQNPGPAGRPKGGDSIHQPRLAASSAFVSAALGPWSGPAPWRPSPLLQRADPNAATFPPRIFFAEGNALGLPSGTGPTEPHFWTPPSWSRASGAHLCRPMALGHNGASLWVLCLELPLGNIWKPRL